MADDDNIEQQDGQGKGGKKKLFLIIGAVVLVLVVGGVAALLLLGGDDEQVEEQPAEPVHMSALYHSMGQPFIANLDDEGRSRLMQVAITVMTRDQAAVDALVLHEPLIRSRLTMVFGSAEFSSLRTAEGKDQLRQAVQDAVQQVLNQESNAGEDAPQIEQVFFEQFVLQ